MKYVHRFFYLLLLFTYLYAAAGHNSGGTSYTKEGIDAYAQLRHGVDGTLFLDPYFLPCIEQVEKARLLDAGCGAGHWAILAAKNGAQVSAIDIQDSMIAAAKKAAQEYAVRDMIDFIVGTVDGLPYADNFFDRALSINVGCNLPPDIFTTHFKELFRTLKSGGRAVITAPTSFDIVFSQGLQGHELEDGISHQALKRLHSILRATFIQQDDKLVLVTDEKMLTEGESIWRKIPGLVVPNFYHSEKRYIQEIRDAGFIIERVDRPRFKDIDEWKQSGCVLSKEYIYYPAFVIFHITKP